MNFNISEVSTTKMTSKGQVVIPEEIRDYMNLEPGVKFLIMASEDSIIFKKIQPLPKRDIRALLEKSQAMAKECGITQSDLDEAIAESRRAIKAKNPVRRVAKRVKVKKALNKTSKRKGKSGS